MPIALILAAGSGERFGAGAPKAFVELAGRPLVQWSVDALRAVAAIEQIVVALPVGADAPVGTSGVQGGVGALGVCAPGARGGRGWAGPGSGAGPRCGAPAPHDGAGAATIRALEADETHRRRRSPRCR